MKKALRLVRERVGKTIFFREGGSGRLRLVAALAAVTVLLGNMQAHADPVTVTLVDLTPDFGSALTSIITKLLTAMGLLWGVSLGWKVMKVVGRALRRVVGGGAA